MFFLDEIFKFTVKENNLSGRDPKSLRVVIFSLDLILLQLRGVYFSTSLVRLFHWYFYLKTQVNYSL